MRQQNPILIQQVIDNKTKPLGALGQLESVAFELALNNTTPDNSKIDVSKPQMLVFAGDHGIAEEAISIAPSIVTTQMVKNFLAGGAAINCFCHSNQIPLTIVDCGILTDLPDTHPYFVKQRLGTTTQNIARQAAMSDEQVHKGLRLGQSLVEDTVDAGCNLLMFGEMGIGNTSSAAALYSAFSHKPTAECVGKGTGIDNVQLDKKMTLVEQAVNRVQDKIDKPVEVLRELGGFEITQMVGGFLGAAASRTPVLVDGFIVSVAAYVAIKINPQVRPFLLFAHQSDEAAHQALLDDMDATPLLNLGLRLGEGTGAALAYPLIKAAAEFYNNMASFEDAGVTV